jgi:CheY-like chemotaxis protein
MVVNYPGASSGALNMDWEISERAKQASRYSTGVKNMINKTLAPFQPHGNCPAFLLIESLANCRRHLREKRYQSIVHRDISAYSNMKNILLVEDNEDDIFFMKRAFREANIPASLTVAHDGQQAMDYIGGIGDFADRARFPLPDLVLLDLQLPFKPGIEVLKWIREQKSLAGMVIVVLTTSREKRDVVAAYQAHSNSYLVKPSHPESLLELVKSLKNYWFERNNSAPVPI